MKTGCVTDIALEDTREVRRKLRDPAHRNNAEFVALMQSEGKLSPDFTKTSPPNVESVQDTTSITIQGQNKIGVPPKSAVAKKIKVV